MYATIDIEAGSIRGPRNCFEIAVTFMFGDADLYTTEVFYYPKDLKDSVVELANFLNETITPEYRRSPEKHPKFNQFIRDEGNSEFWVDEPLPDGSYYNCKYAQLEEWPYDVDGHGVGKFEKMNVRYINKMGNIHRVNLK